MSRVPEDIDGLGKSTERLRQNPQFDLGSYQFDRDSYFVWSRLDGFTSTRDVILMVGFDTGHTIAILQALRAAGAVLLSGETPADLAARRAEARARRQATEQATPAAQQAAGAKARQAAPPVGEAKAAASADTAAARRDTALFLDQLDEDEAAALAAQVELSDEVKLRILTMRRKVRASDYFALFGVATDADARELKRAYFRLSKEFHPDRYYRKDTGPFGPWLGEIFAALSRAFEVLSDDAARQRYVAALSGAAAPARASQSREDYARQLFERACSAETSGNLAGALKLFAAALRVDGQARYSSRAARCAIAAGELALAEDYARKAASMEPGDPSVARILADVYRAAGKLELAEQTLVTALGLKSENDVLGKELASDLAAVRQALARSR